MQPPVSVDLTLRLWKEVSRLSDLEAALRSLAVLLDLHGAALWQQAGDIRHRVSSFGEPNDLEQTFELRKDDTVYFLNLSPSQDISQNIPAEILTEAVEVFGVVLERHLEIQRHEAAEAERQAALARLGRKELGDEIVGRNRGLRTVMERIEQVATSDLPVLILGETGTGKELVARTIHQRSTRAKNLFHRVNCGAIPPELVDSQLFGHERGSFTGATDLRKGWFERADGGTLFLDEIGELPLAAQVRLLRILQDGHFERVGGQKSLSCDVRIVAATNQDLAQAVAEGRFRADLWYRIAVFPIRIPPLRERVEDIPSLAEHFAERAATRFGLLRAHPTDAEFRLLAAYPWPGNVRELGSVIDRAAILGNGRRLEIAASLGMPIPTPSMESEPSKPAATLHPSMEESFDETVRKRIESVLETTRGRVDGPFGAAKLLGLNPNTLRSKLRKFGIDPKRFREK